MLLFGVTAAPARADVTPPDVEAFVPTDFDELLGQRS